MPLPLPLPLPSLLQPPSPLPLPPASSAISSGSAFKPRKAAYAATVYSHLAAFHLPFMEDLRAAGYEVHAYACPDALREEVERAGFECRDVPFSRNPLSPGNVKALAGMYRHFKLEQYDLVHVHTPNAGWITRLAAFAAGARNIFYTAHGFHFYKGAPLLNWLLYYPLEWLAARFTDVLITINGEDYGRAGRFRLRGAAALLPGVGVEENYGRSHTEGELADLRQELLIPDGAFVLLCMAELNGNKNQGQLLRAVHDLINAGIPVCCLLAGEGSHEQRYRALAGRLGIRENVQFLGYRRDGSRLMAAADVVVLLSQREGLPKVLLESLSAGKPVVASDVRGCRDLVAHGTNGFRVAVGDTRGTAQALSTLYRDAELRKRMGQAGRSRFAGYRLDAVRQQLAELYREHVKDREGEEMA